MAEDFVEDIIKETDNAEVNKNDITAEMTKTTTDSADELVDDKKEDKVDDKVEDKSEETLKNEDGSNKSVEQIEDLAEKLGWNKDYQGEDKVDASTYILKSREIQDTMRDYNKDLKNQIATLQQSIKALQSHNENVYKTEVKRLEQELTKLQKEKRDAVELADVAKVDELDAKINDLQKDLNSPKMKPQANEEVNPAYQVWIEDNKWYEENDEMAVFADNVAQQYQGAPVERIYAIVRQKVQEVFPEKFETSTKKEEVKKDVVKEKPIGPKSPVESGSKRENNDAFTVNDLSADQRAIMNQFVKMGIMTEKQYIADIAKMQEG